MDSLYVKVAGDLVGEDALVEMSFEMGSEDFRFSKQKIPGVFPSLVWVILKKDRCTTESQSGL